MGYVRTAGLSTAARRTRRRAALVITGLLAVLALVLLLSVAGMQGWFSLGEGGGDDSAASTAAVVPAPALTAQQVTVNVFNSTSTVGLAGRTADGLRVRGFEVGSIDNSEAIEGTGIVRHGPEGAEAAELLEQAAGQDLELTLDEEREGTEVDLVLGPDWQELPSADDAAQTDGR